MFLNKTNKVTTIHDGSVLNATAFGTAKVAQKAIKDIAIVEAQIFPTSATGEYLDKAAALYGVSPRKQALGSSTFVRVFASPGTQYAVGTQFVSKNGIRFVTDQLYTVDSLGYGYVSVRSTITGSVTNVEANSIVQVTPRPLTHIECTNEYAAIGGRDYEDDETFRNRIINYNNKLSEDTMESWTQIFQDLDDRILKVMNVGLGEDGKMHIYLVTQNGSFFTDAELEILLEKATPYFGLTELNLSGETVGIVLENAKWMYVGGEEGIDFRVELNPNMDIATARKNIQIAMTKYLDFRFWEAGKSVQWDDLLQVVKTSEGVKYVPDEYFFPYFDQEVPLNMLPRIKGFRMRDLEGNILYDSGSNLSNIFYPASDDNIYKGSQSSILAQKYLVSFIVTNLRNVPVPGAYITIGNKVIITDANGTANVLLENGEYQYSLNKANWTQQNGEFVVLNGPIYININDFTATPYLVTFTVYEGEAPMEGATIQVSTSTLETNASGEATVELEPGTYSYTITKAGFKDITSVLTVENQPVEIFERMFLTTLSVNFAVIDNRRNIYVPQANIIVTNKSELTDNEGQAEMGLEVGEYEMTVNKEGYQTYQKTLKVESEDPNCVLVELDAIPYEVKITVKDADSGLVISGASVKVGDSTELTDDQGIAIISVPSGSFEMTVFKSGYMSYSGIVTIEDESISQIVELHKAFYTFRLTVRDIENGNFIAGAELNVDGNTVITNINGVANITLGNGTYEYTVIARNYKKYTGTVVVKDQDIVETIYIELRDTVINYTVNDALTGDPISGVLIELVNKGTGLTMDSGTTNALGKVSLEGEAGDYEWNASHKWYLPVSGEITLEKLQDQDVSFKMTRKEIDGKILVMENLPGVSGITRDAYAEGSNFVEALSSDGYYYGVKLPLNLIVSNWSGTYDLSSYYETYRRPQSGGVDEPYNFEEDTRATLTLNLSDLTGQFALDGTQITAYSNIATPDRVNECSVDFTVTTGDDQATVPLTVTQKATDLFLPVKAGLKVSMKSPEGTVTQLVTDANGNLSPFKIMPGKAYEFTITDTGFYNADGKFIATWDFENNPTFEMQITASKQIDLNAREANTNNGLSAHFDVSGMSVPQSVNTGGTTASAKIYISPVSMVINGTSQYHNNYTYSFTPLDSSLDHIDAVFTYEQMTVVIRVKDDIYFDEAHFITNNSANCYVKLEFTTTDIAKTTYVVEGKTNENGVFTTTGNGSYNIPPGNYKVTVGAAGLGSNFDVRLFNALIQPALTEFTYYVDRKKFTAFYNVKEIIPGVSDTAKLVKAGLKITCFYNTAPLYPVSDLVTNANGSISQEVYAGFPYKFQVQPNLFYEGDGVTIAVDYAEGQLTQDLVYTCSKRIPVHVSSDHYGDLSGSKVVFKGMSVDQTQTIDNAGLCYMWLSPIAMTYEISHDWYQTITGSFTPDGTETRMDFELKALSYPVTFNVSTGGILPPENITVRIENQDDPTLIYQGVTDVNGVAIIPDVLTGNYTYSVLAGEITTGTFSHPQTAVGSTVNVEVTYELINAQIEVRELYGSASVFAALANKTLTMTSKAGSITITLDENGTAVMTLIKGLEYTFAVDDNANFYSNPTQSYTWTEDGFVWNMNLNVTAQITINVKDTYSNANISSANIQYNLQTKATDTSGNAVFYRSALTKDFSVTKDDYRITTGNIEATTTSPLNVKLYRELQSVTINVNEIVPDIPASVLDHSDITYSNAAGSGTLTTNGQGSASFNCYLGIVTTFTVVNHADYYSNPTQTNTFTAAGATWIMNLTCSKTLIVHVEASVPVGEAINGATVSYFGQTGTTDTSGNVTLYRSGLDKALSVSADYLESYSGTITNSQTSPVNIVLTRAANPVKIHIVESIPGVTNTFAYASKKINWSVGSTTGTLTTDASGNATINGYLGTEMTFKVEDDQAYFYSNPSQKHTFAAANEVWDMTLVCSASIRVNVKSNAPSANIASASVSYFGQTKTTDSDGDATFYRSGLDRPITSTATYHANYSGTILSTTPPPFNIVMSRNQATVSVKVVETIPNITGTNIYASQSLTMTKNGAASTITLDVNGTATVTTYLGIATTFAVVNHSNYYSNPSQNYTFTAANQTFNMSLTCAAQIVVNVKSNMPASTNLQGASLTYFNQTKTTDASGNASFYRSGLDKPINGSATYFNAYIGTVAHGQATPYNITFTRTTVTVTLTVMEKLGAYTGALASTTIARTSTGGNADLALDASGKKSNTVYAGLTYTYAPKSYSNYYSNGTQSHVWTKEGEAWTMTMTSNTQITFNIKSANYGTNLSGVTASCFGQSGTTDASGNYSCYRGAKAGGYGYSFSKSLYNSISGTIAVGQASPVNFTMSETTSSIVITIKDNYYNADKGNANGCPVTLTNKNKPTVTFSGSSNSSGQVSFGPMIQGTYTLSWGGGDSYWNGQSVDITMPTATIQKSAVRKTSTITTAWYFRIPTTGTADHTFKNNTLYKPVVTAGGTTTTVTLTATGSDYKNFTYTYVAGLSTTINLATAYFVTGIATSNTPVVFTPTHNFSNVSSQRCTAIKAITVTVQNSLTGAALSGVTVQSWGIDGNSTVGSGTQQSQTTNASGQCTMYVSGLTNRYRASLANYDTLEVTNSGVTSFVLKLMPSAINVTVNVKRTDNTSLVAANCMVKFASSNSGPTQYSGTTNSSGQVVISIRPGTFWWQTGATTAWNSEGGDSNFPSPYTSSSAIALNVAQTITIYAVYVNTAGWYGTLETSGALTYSQINYTGLQNVDVINTTFCSAINLNYSSATSYLYAWVGAFYSNQYLTYSILGGAVNLSVRNLLYNAQSSTSLMYAKSRILFKAISSSNRLAVVATASQISVSAFNSYCFLVRSNTPYASGSSLEVASQIVSAYSTTNLINQIVGRLNSYTLPCGIYLGSVAGNILSYFFALRELGTMAIARIGDYSGGDFVDLRVSFSNSSSSSAHTIKFIPFLNWNKFVAVQYESFNNKYIITKYDFTLNLTSSITFTKITSMMPGSILQKMDANFWISPDGIWMFSATKTNGLHSYYMNGQNFIVSINVDNDDKYVDTAETSEIRSVLGTTHKVLEIIFNKDESSGRTDKMIILTNDNSNTFSDVLQQGMDSYNPTGIYYFQLNFLSSRWERLSSTVIDKHNVWNTYMQAKDSSGFSGATLSNNIIDDAGNFSLSWAFPAHSDNTRIYKTNLIWNVSN